MGFVHLHVHTQYSVLDGAARIDELIARAKEYDMNAIAITDHGNMFGAMEFASKANKAGIKPIIGCEVYVAPGLCTDKGKNSSENNESKYASHLVLLAKNRIGYDNLIKLVSIGYTEGFYRKPRIDHNLIEKYSEGLICTSACLGGEIPQRIMIRDAKGADSLVKWYKGVFGENFYLEMQDHGLPEQKGVNAALFKLAKENNVPIIVTNDVHYTDKDDAKAHEVLLCVQTQSKLTDPGRFRFGSDEFYMKSEEEMRKLFPKMNSAFANTVKIADECELEIETTKHFMPEYKTPEGMDKSEYFKKICKEKLEERYNSNIPKEALERLDFEVSVISDMGFEGYFLIVQDFINYAKKEGILVGPGRGSAAGSIVAWALGITEVNPLNYDLLFERFLNPARKSMPDIDVDFPDDRRQDVINYVIKKYGEENVSQIVTFGTLNGRSVIRDVCRVLDIPLDIADSVAKKIPEGGKGIKETYESDNSFRELIDNEYTLSRMYQLAVRLEGLVRSVGLHAAGVIISSEPIASIAPLYRDAKTEKTACQFEMNYVENSGLVKMDFLGIKNLRLIKEAVDTIASKHGNYIDINALALNDEKTFELFKRGDTSGVFQFESDGMRNLLINLKPTAFEDLVAAVALYRPGPLGSGMHITYANRKNGKEAVSYPHEDLKPILEATYGGFIYQEQIMLTSRVLGGFEPSEADDLRKAMGKKKADMMAKLRVKFIEGGQKKGYKKDFLEKIYSDMQAFAEYGFNKSHSVCYALVAYQEAYIKAHYPVEFYVALLNTVTGDTDKINAYLSEVRLKNIEIIPPSINICGALFKEKEGKIAYGLSAIKGIGYSAAENIEKEREENGEFKDMFDLARRANTSYMTKRVYEALIKSGAMECFGYTQASLLESLDTIVSYASAKQREKSYGQSTLFDSSAESVATETNITPLPESALPILRLNEEETLGFSLRHHPFIPYAHKIDYRRFHSTQTVKNLKSGEEFFIPGVLTMVKDTQTKSGKPMVILEISDLSGKYTFYLSNKRIMQKCEKNLTQESAVVIKGQNSEEGDFKRIEEIISLDEALEPKSKKLASLPKRRRSNVTETTIREKQQESAEEEGVFKNASKIDVYFAKNMFNDTELFHLRSILSDNQGECSMYMHLLSPEGDQCYILPNKIAPSNKCVEEIKMLRSFRNIISKESPVNS